MCLIVNQSSRFVKDNDGHWYLIPSDLKDTFDTWVNAMENDLAWDGQPFDKCRCDCPSFYEVIIVKEL